MRFLACLICFLWYYNFPDSVAVAPDINSATRFGNYYTLQVIIYRRLFTGGSRHGGIYSCGIVFYCHFSERGFYFLCGSVVEYKFVFLAYLTVMVFVSSGFMLKRLYGADACIVSVSSMSAGAMLSCCVLSVVFEMVMV